MQSTEGMFVAVLQPLVCMHLCLYSVGGCSTACNVARKGPGRSTLVCYAYMLASEVVWCIVNGVDDSCCCSTWSTCVMRVGTYRSHPTAFGTCMLLHWLCIVAVQ